MLHPSPIIPSVQDLQTAHSRLRSIPAQAPWTFQPQAGAIIGNSAMNQLTSHSGTNLPTLSEKTDFPLTAATIGTEQELADIKVRLPISFPDHRLGVIHLRTSDGIFHLWDITKDMPFFSNCPEGYCDFTIEMVSAPAPIEDSVNWITRQEAFNEFVKELRLISFSPVNERTLKTKQIGRFEMTLLTPAVIVIEDEHMSSINSSFQYTKGVTLSNIPNLMAEENVPWFRQDLMAWAASRSLDNPSSQIVFAYVMSAALKDCEIYCSLFDGTVDRTNTLILASTAKNRWGILPRMPLRAAITLLADQEQQKVLTLVANYHPSPVVLPVVFYERYQKLVGSMLGTQTVTRVGEINTEDTIKGEPIFLFENRLPGPTAKIPAYIQWKDSAATLPPLPTYGDWLPLVWNQNEIGAYRPEGMQMGIRLTIAHPLDYQKILELGIITHKPPKTQTYPMRYSLNSQGSFNGWILVDHSGKLSLKFQELSQEFKKKYHLTDPVKITNVTACYGK